MISAACAGRLRNLSRPRCLLPLTDSLRGPVQTPSRLTCRRTVPVGVTYFVRGVCWSDFRIGSDDESRVRREGLLSAGGKW